MEIPQPGPQLIGRLPTCTVVYLVILPSPAGSPNYDTLGSRYPLCSSLWSLLSETLLTISRLDHDKVCPFS